MIKDLKRHARLAVAWSRHGSLVPRWTCRINTISKHHSEEEGERLIKDLKRKANSLSRDTRQASALGLEGGPPPLENIRAEAYFCSNFGHLLLLDWPISFSKTDLSSGPSVNLATPC